MSERSAADDDGYLVSCFLVQGLCRRQNPPKSGSLQVRTKTNFVHDFGVQFFYGESATWQTIPALALIMRTSRMTLLVPRRHHTAVWRCARAPVRPSNVSKRNAFRHAQEVNVGALT